MKMIAQVMTCLAVATLGGVPGAEAADQTAVQQILDRVFGDAVTLDPAMAAKVIEGTPGERHYVDRDADGKLEEVWFVDTAQRHSDSWRPVLVRAIDEDGDLEMGLEPDLDSDLYVADWKADGSIDSVCDYTDRDGDNDVDEVLLYYSARSSSEVMIWWGDDVGDDNLLWYDVGYTYRQGACQYRSHFGGDELFCAYTLGLNDAEWLPGFENPFVFYDRDGDGVTEEVIRIEGRGDIVHNVRHSFDADDDATSDNPRDFDVCISAHAPKGLTFDDAQSDRRTLRGIPTTRFLSYEATPKFSLETQWADMLLCWDENDLNIDGDNLTDGRFRDIQERWEGVICKGNEYFRQLGGPSCGPFNKRFEVATAPKGLIRVYYAPTDQRIHLFGADHLWLAVDYDYDQQPDMRYEYLDVDADGYIDTWRLDLDHDGEPDDEWTAGAETQDVAYTWPAVSGVMKPVLEAVPEQLFGLVARLRQAARKAGGEGEDAVWQLVESGFDIEGLSEEVRLRLLASRETSRYYLDLIKDRLIAALKAKHQDPAFWGHFDALRGKGDLAGMQAALEAAFGLTGALPDLAAWRAGIVAKYDQPRVAWAQDWVPPNIGWESDVAGYRAYWGQFDFFGKKRKCLVMSTFGEQYSYHEEQAWGMDALHLGQSCGLGGVTLYVNGKAYPVWSPEGKGSIAWSKQLLSESDDAVTVELLAENVGPEAQPYAVRFRCEALAGRKDSPIEVTFEGGKPEDAVELGLNLQKLPHEDFAVDDGAGIVANWGWQDQIIGTIGMGLVYPKGQFVRHVDTDHHHQVVMKPDDARAVRYNIQGDWLRGRRFPRCPTLENWLEDLRATARLAALN